MKKRKFITILCGGFIPYVFEDLRHDERVTVFNQTVKNINNPVLKVIRKIHLGKKIDERVHLPFKNIWGSCLDDIKWEDDTQYYVIFLEPYPLKPSYLNNLREKHNVKYILYAGFVWDDDTYYSKMQRDYSNEISYDYIFSSNPLDVKKYGFEYNNFPYSTISKADENITNENDLYLIGKASGRAQNRLKIFQDVYNVLSNYQITEVPEDKQIYRDEIIYNKVIEYPKVIDGIKKSNCILEVLAEGQTGETLRYYEAVCYNKKLLTTNKNIVNLPFYNPKYMKVFEKPDDIDCDWVKERIPIDYGYDGRFSPSRLIDKIIELEEQKEG